MTKVFREKDKVLAQTMDFIGLFWLQRILLYILWCVISYLQWIFSIFVESFVKADFSFTLLSNHCVFLRCVTAERQLSNSQRWIQVSWDLCMWTVCVCVSYVSVYNYVSVYVCVSCDLCMLLVATVNLVTLNHPLCLTLWISNL